jgi:hypothetical protein
LLVWSGGCATRTIRYASTCSNSARRHPLTSLRYSVADEGRAKRKPKAKSQKTKPLREHKAPTQ